MEFHRGDLFFGHVLYMQIEPGFGTECLICGATREASQALQMHIDMVDSSLTGTPHEAIATAPLPSQEVHSGLVRGVGIYFEMQCLLVHELKIA